MTHDHISPCPFCGFILNINDPDCIYPATISEYDETIDKMVFYLYEINCYENGGGCGASILGDSIDDCINKWNTRV